MQLARHCLHDFVLLRDRFLVFIDDPTSIALSHVYNLAGCVASQAKVYGSFKHQAAMLFDALVLPLSSNELLGLDYEFY